jgi:hypothetical protein
MRWSFTSPFRLRNEVEENADKLTPPVSERKRREGNAAAAVLAAGSGWLGPTGLLVCWAGPRGHGARWKTGQRPTYAGAGKQAAKRASRPPGKKVSCFYFFLLSFLHLFIFQNLFK